jgi:alkaline phosphatase/alkaline phosphatase D
MNRSHAPRRLKPSRRDVLTTTSSLVATALLPGVNATSAAPGTGAEHAATVATLISGEPTQTSIILQARLSRGLPVVGVHDGATPGLPAEVRFEISETSDFQNPSQTAWHVATDASDYIAKARVQGLKPNVRYFYRLEARSSDGRSIPTLETGSFSTLPTEDASGHVSCAVFSCLNYEKFFGFVAGARRGKGAPGAWSRPAEGRERARGYPAMDAILEKKVQFLIATGDTVYYDSRGNDERIPATSVAQMRTSWHKQFAVASVRDALSSHGTFWMKDDHDFRFDDADNTTTRLPGPIEGRAVFLEQVPAPQPTYRTYRLNRHAQIWLLEGRDYRSPNAVPDNPQKTLWGAEQRRWLEQSLLRSGADFKIIISPGSLVGPDDANKKDNHTNRDGFRKEGEAFLRFLRDNGLISSTVLITGDRHWQSHSIHPTGVEEFCCGTVHRQNGRYGVKPGEGTDPEGRIRQPYITAEPEGGFIQVDVGPEGAVGKATLVIRFWAETGELRHEAHRVA